MDRTQLFVLGILVIMAIIINRIMYAKKTIYFFISEDDDSINKLKELLNDPNNEIILVNYKQNINLEKLNSLINQCSNRSLIKDIINVEGMEDLQGVLVDSCYKNAKCVNQPHDQYYAIKEKLNVFGFPFDFQFSPYDLNLMPNVYKPNTNLNRLKNYINIPSCGKRR